MNASRYHGTTPGPISTQITSAPPTTRPLTADEWESWGQQTYAEQRAQLRTTHRALEQDVAAAQARAEIEAANEHEQSPHSPKCWDYVVALFEAWYDPAIRQRATRAKVFQCLQDLRDASPAPGRINAMAISTLIARWKADGNVGKTVNSKLKVVRGITNKIFKLFALGSTPFDLHSWWVDEDEDDRDRHLSAEEIRSILRQTTVYCWAAEHDRSYYADCRRWKAARRRALVHLLAYTGLRATEALTLRTIDLDLHEGFVNITGKVKRTKTRASRACVPLPATACTIMSEWLLVRGSAEFIFRQRETDRSWLGGGPGYKPLDEIKALGKRANVDGLTLLAFRHSWATHAESLWGLSETQIQRVLRHTTVKTQQHYRHADRANLRLIADRVDFGSNLQAN
jgi:integrase